jgi:two-component system, cell cycle sensor histidine kinase and response regulator CckA
MIVERAAHSRDASKPIARVFLVEDEPIIALELDDRLREMGYEVCGHARRAEEALRGIAASQPDLVITDVRLAGEMNGIELVARLRERSDVPVIFLTADDDVARMRGAAEPGPFAHVKKPFNAEVLRPNVELVLVRRDLQRSAALIRHASGLATLSGEEFFDEVASQLLDVLGLDGAFVGVIVPSSEEPRIRTITRWSDGKKAQPIEFDLLGSPCSVALQESSIVVVDDVRQHFPGVPLLEETGAAGYAAIALLDRKGRAIGSIGVLSRSALAEPERVAETLRLFAVRTAAELERGRAEARFQELFEFSPDGILMVDENGLIVVANRRAELLFGYSREELIGLAVEMLMPEANGPKHVEQRRRFLASSAPRSMGTRDRPLYARRRDGTTFPVDIGLGPLRTDDGLLVIAAVRDISDRLSAEAERGALEEQLRQSQKMESLGTLAGGIAHDFNNLLTIIVANLELAQLGASGALGEQLADIGAAASRASVLVRQILAFSRRQPPRSVLMRLLPVVEEVVKLLRASLPANVTIALSSGEPPPSVFADPDQIHQVLMNLGTNAWQSIGGRSGRVVLNVEGVHLGGMDAARLGLLPGPHACIVVSDDGDGIDAETLRRIFEPFFTTKGVGRGTGLGLSIVHGIVREAGGAIAVDSRPGRGTAFSVYLPEALGEVRTSITPAAAPTRGRGRVLFLDDELLVVRVATRMLRRLGYEPVGFIEVKDALDAVRAAPDAFDLVITDWNMPEMNGLDVARALRAIRGDLRVGLTSGEHPIPEEALAAAGVRALLDKPFALGQLADFVHVLGSDR